MTNVLILENHNKIRFFFLVNNRSQYWGIIANEVLQPRFPRLGVQDMGHVEEGESCWSWLPSGNRNQDSKETWQTRICRGMLTCSVYVLPEADQENTAAGKGMETGQLNRVPKCDVIKNEICEIMGFVKLF